MSDIEKTERFIAWVIAKVYDADKEVYKRLKEK